jgi:pilus assembly protein TadC
VTRTRLVLAAVAAGGAAALLAGGVPGVIVGPLVGFAGYRWLSRQPSREDAARELRVADDLPFAADLLAAALRAGAAPDVAARCTAAALGGPFGERLARVERALSLGASAEEAWSYLGAAEGTRRIVLAAVRSQHSGAAFAGALQRVADDVRADRLIAADAAGRRAGVLIVLPLGLCFLPAFVLAGLVPVIVAVLGDVLSPS